MKALLAGLMVLGGAGWFWSWRSAGAEIRDVRRELSDRDSTLAERDHQLATAASVARILGEIETELGQVRGAPGMTPVSAESPLDFRRQASLARIRELGRWLDRQRTALAEAARKSARLEGDTVRLSNELEDRLATIDGLTALAERQRAEIDALERKLVGLEAENRDLKAGAAAFRKAAARVFVVAGTRQELLSRGIAVEEGGLKMPFAGRELATLVPARSLSDSAFSPLDRDADTVVVLPKPDRFYRLVSRHDAGLLAGAEGPGKLLKGRATISAPASFWRPSPYLILEEIPPDSEVWR